MEQLATTPAIVVERNVTNGRNSGRVTLMMRTSTDLKRWSATQLASAGKQGEFNTRVYWTRLASSDRVWVPELSVADPIPWRLVGANVEGRNIQGPRG